MAELLTVNERLALGETADLWTRLSGIVGDGPSRIADLAELATHIHAIQRAIMAQAAARECPHLYRLLGQVIDRESV